MDSHPDMDTLVAYAGGELPPDRLAAVADHVSCCWDCRIESVLLAEAIEASAASGLANRPEPGVEHLSRILVGIHEWRTKNLSPGRREEVVRRVAAILAPYLGPAGAEAVVRPALGNSEALLATVEPVLVLFLGRQAASRLVTEIVDSAILEV